MTPTPPPAPPVSAWRWWVCLLLFLATTLNYMDRVALNQMAKRIKDALDLDPVEYSRLETAFSFFFALGAILAGVVVDRVNVRWVYTVAVLGWSAAGFLTGYATGFWSLVACRLALGIFESANWPAGLRTTRAILRPEERSFGNALFQSGTAIGAVVTPFLVLYLLQEADAAGGDTRNSWRVPFRMIGMIGAGWVVLWLLTVPRGLLARATGDSHPGDPGLARYRDIFRDIRFWALIGMTVSLNIAWHTYRVWLPLYLQEVRGFDEAAMSRMTTWFYITADVGSWTIGILTLLLVRRGGWNSHGARVLMFAACAALALVSLIVPLVPTGRGLTVVVLLFAFASLGLFPTYYAFSQEISGKHQGKVSGTLGLFAHMSLSLVFYPIQGMVVRDTGSYDLILAAAGVFPLLALLFMWRVWPAPRTAEPPSA
jgi:MFS transporter, ACS family, hexuronate transporter